MAGSGRRPCATPGQMVLHHLPGQPQEADVRGRQATLGNLEDVWLSLADPDCPATPIRPSQFCLIRLIDKITLE